MGSGFEVKFQTKKQQILEIPLNISSSEASTKVWPTRLL
jgi:hypothetical protein